MNKLNIPEPYATKARALLKPWHPLFKFDLWMEDSDLLFSIALRNIMSRDEWLYDHFKTHHVIGVYPLAAFERIVFSDWVYRMQSRNDRFKPEQSEEDELLSMRFERFATVVFRAVNHFVRTLLPDTPASAFPLLSGHQMDVLAVVKWLKIITDPLGPWLDWHIRYESDILSLIAAQPTCHYVGKDSPGWFIKDVGQDVRPWHGFQPMEMMGLNMANVTMECAEIARSQGIVEAERQLRKLLYERLTNGLYFMRFAIPEPSAKPEFDKRIKLAV